MQAFQPTLPVISVAEAGTRCRYCDTTDSVLVVEDADQWTCCVLCLAEAVDLPMGWNLSNVWMVALRNRNSAKGITRRKR